MNVTTTNIKNEVVRGQLISRFDGIVTFVPDINPYGENRITLHTSRIAIGAEDDDNCILVQGYMGLPQKDTYKMTFLSFFPVK